jgi:thiosulfate/3-mercaptopyruvate sulfurtransferase
MTDDKTANLVEQPELVSLQLPGLIVGPDWLAQYLNHPALCLLDVRLRDSYDEGHIPGAVWLDLSTLTCSVRGVPGMVLPPEPFVEQMRRQGLSQGSPVVIYDDHWGMPAARVLWSLARYGHHNAAVLNGGWDRWLAEGRLWTAEPVIPDRGHFVAKADESHLAEGAWLRSANKESAVTLVDTRTPAEFSQGHLPDAICWDWMNGVPRDSWDIRRSADELLDELTGLGITPDKEIVTYCQSGARAAHTYLLLRDLEAESFTFTCGTNISFARVEHK